MAERFTTMGDVGVLVVHGIGKQAKGEMRAKLLAGLKHFRAGGVEVDPRAARAIIGGQAVRFYEVHWANILQGDEKMAGAFFLPELQSIAWFPWLNARRGNYRTGDYTTLTIVWWSVVLPLMNFLILLAYYGARLLALVPAVFDVGATETRRTPSEAAREARSVRTAVDRVLDEYAGDVFAYVNSAGQGFYRESDEPAVRPALVEAYSKIAQCFYDELLRARADGCTTIQVVAHSLGSVVAYHALSGYRFDLARPDAGQIRGALAKVSHLYTIGSPLEKIRFMWPRLQVTEPLLPGMILRWDNFVSWFDPVAGRLRRFNQWSPVVNRRLLGGGFIRGHVVYERSPVFLQVLAHGLCGREVRFVRTTKERWTDTLMLVGETLVAPLGLAVVLIAGLAVFAVAAGLLPFLISLPLRPFMPAALLGRLEDGFTLVMVASMVGAFLIGPKSRAGRQHGLHSGNTRPLPPEPPGQSSTSRG